MTPFCNVLTATTSKLKGQVKRTYGACRVTCDKGAGNRRTRVKPASPPVPARDGEGRRNDWEVDVPMPDFHGRIGIRACFQRARTASEARGMAKRYFGLVALPVGTTVERVG